MHVIELIAKFPFGELSGFCLFGHDIDAHHHDVKLVKASQASHFNDREHAEDMAMLALGQITEQTISIQVSWDYNIL